MMEDSEICRIIESHIDDGIGSDKGDISNQREEILDRYYGHLYGDELAGESKVTSRDIQEVIEWTLPSLLRHFTAGDNALVFDPVDPNDEQAAEQETFAVRQQFWKDNNGFVVLYLIIKTILMNPNGYVKVYRDERERVTFEHYRNLDIQEVQMVMESEGIEVIEQYETDDENLYDIKIKRTLTRGKNLVVVCPEDEVVIDGDWSDLDIDECPFTCHYPERTHSELLEMGYPEDDLDEAYSVEAESSEESNRNIYSDETYSDDESHKALRKYTVYECSMMLDVDEDGIAERRRVVKIGNKIFENEEDDYQPLVSGATILMPHKHAGLSMAQQLLDLQEIKTVLWRQLFNNSYRVNNPRTIVTKGANLNDVLTQGSGGVLRAKTVDDIKPEPVQPIIQHMAPLIEMVDQAKEYRSGITKNSTVPDVDMMRETAQGSYLKMVERADQRVDLLARLLGETVVKQIYLKLHGLIQRHGDAKYMKIPGGFVYVDPTTWRTRESMTCTIGLGFASKQQRLMAAQAIKADHDYLVQNGAIADPEKGRVGLVTLQHVYEGRKLLIESMGIEDVTRYYMDPSTIQKVEQPPPPDANLLMIQSNERIEQGRSQVKVMELRQRQQLEMIKAQTTMAREEREFRWKQLESEYEKRIEQAQLAAKEAERMGRADAEQAKLELAAITEQLQDAQDQEKQELARYEADLRSATQILLKRMDLGTADDSPGLEAVRNEIGANQEQTQAALAQIAGLIAEMRQPKEIVYDDDGEIVGVRNAATGEVRPLRRGPGGEPVGLG